MSQHVFRGVLWFFRHIGFARLEVRSDLLSARAKVLIEEAKRRGIPTCNYVFFGKPTEAFRARVRDRIIEFVALPRPVSTQSGSESWIDDKWVLKQKFLEGGIPVPKGYSCASEREAEAAFAALQKPVVVKPRVGSRGRHTTTHVHTLQELRSACARARELCRWIVVEEHLVGAVYRGTLVGGKLVGVLSGEPPRVVGDGARTIRELVEHKNATRHAKVSAVVLGEQHALFLARTGRTFESVPKQGEVLDLLEKIGVSYGGNSAEVTPRTHSLTKEILQRAASLVDDPMIGFDFIIPDIARSPHIQRWGIIECNSNPFINLHHDPVEGEPVNAASAVWEYVENNLEAY